MDLSQIIREHVFGEGFGPAPRSGSFFLQLQKLANNSPKKFAFVVLIWIVWFNTIPIYNKIVAMVFATLFSGIEYCFTTVTDSYLKTGKWEGGATTPEQWLLNVLIIPIIIPVYYGIVQSDELTFDIFAVFEIDLLTVIFSGVWVWVLEIIEGYFMIYLFGWNRCWQYFGKDAMFDGTIKLGYLPFWLIMGFAMECVFRSYILRMDTIFVKPIIIDWFDY